jgi:uncharacterized protein (TIGR02147 family)
MSKEPTLNYRQILLRELASRTRRNPGYSLRAFARDLGIPAPKLSQALRGIKGFSAERAQAIAQRIPLSAEESELFVDLVESEHARSKVGKLQAQERLARKSKADGFAEIDLERFQIISDWFHFAILELTDVHDFDSSPRWISQRLGVSLAETEKAIERLLDFGLLSKTKKNTLKQTQTDLATPSGIPSRPLREQHSQLLQKADGALEKFTVNERDFSAITLAVSTADIPKAKILIKDFRRKFNGEMQKAPKKDRIYCISVQFFPLDQKKKDF